MNSFYDSVMSIIQKKPYWSFNNLQSQFLRIMFFSF